MKNTHFTRSGPGRKHPTMAKKEYKELKKAKFLAKLEKAKEQND